MSLLEYSKWENFNNVIQKAVTSYKNSNNDNSYWLPEVRKPIITGKGTTKQDELFDYVEAPDYYKERVRDYDEYDYDKDDFDLSR